MVPSIPPRQNNTMSDDRNDRWNLLSPEALYHILNQESSAPIDQRGPAQYDKDTLRRREAVDIKGRDAAPLRWSLPNGSFDSTPRRLSDAAIFRPIY